ncbi:hypothetical protein ACA910_006279 [Epithemia clementina (nom. ined.)]
MTDHGDGTCAADCARQEDSIRTGTTASSAKSETLASTYTRSERTTAATPLTYSVEHLNLSEKLKIISGKSLWLSAPVPRLQIPSIRLSDGPHGVRKPVQDFSLQRAYPATCFPTAAALACSWDPATVKEVGRALRSECVHYDIQVLLGPGMNLKRHPCGGRNFEYFSEDPYLTGKLASAYIHGVEGTGQVAACAKHFAVNNQESHRFVVNAVVDERTLRELYLRHFEMVVKEASPSTMMCAYNKVNGQYCSENEHLSKNILRGEWGYDGVLISDWGAVNDRAAGIKAQLDLEMPGSHGAHNREIRKALSEETLTEADIDKCARRVLALVDKMRESDEEESDGRRSSTRQKISWPFQHDIAKRVATDCAVLLTNRDDFLPLDPVDVKSVAVIGEFGKNFPRYQGMGSSHVNAEWVRAAYDEVFRFCEKVDFSRGYDVDDDRVDRIDEEMLQEAIQVASSAQVVILCVGLPEIIESEGFDRPHMTMPAQHSALVKEISKVNKNLVLVLSNGSVIEMPWVNEPKAIFECFLLGEAGGAAIVDMIFGIQSPSGRLSETISIKQEDHLSDKYFPGTRDTVEYREGLDVGYRYFDSAKKEVRFPFGHGLTYTTFEYSGMNVQVLEDETRSKYVELTFNLTNAGDVSAKEVVQCYIHQVNPSVYRPIHELKAFEKIYLHPGEFKKVILKLTFDSFSFYDVGFGDWIVEPDAFEIRVGASSRDIRLTEKINFKTGQMASEDARKSYPPKPNGVILSDVDDDTFNRRFLVGSTSRAERTSEPSLVEPGFNRNSLLKEVAAITTLGKFLKWVVLKGATADLKPGPSLKRDEKILEIAVQNLPLRTMVLFGGGVLSFELMDAMIASMNGFYLKALWLFLVAFTPFRRKAWTSKPAL